MKVMLLKDFKSSDNESYWCAGDVVNLPEEKAHGFVSARFADYVPVNTKLSEPKAISKDREWLIESLNKIDGVSAIKRPNGLIDIQWGISNGIYYFPNNSMQIWARELDYNLIYMNRTENQVLTIVKALTETTKE